MRKTTLLLALAIAGLSHPANGQEYSPREKMPENGSEVVMVLLSTSGCMGNSYEGFDDAVREAKQVLRDRIEATGEAFFTVGVAKQWDIQEGLDYLLHGKTESFGDLDFGAWDEVSAGRSWLNEWVLNLVWRDEDGIASVPQVLLLRRSVVPEETGISVGSHEVLRRVNGSDSIVEWFNEGMPLDHR